MQFVGLRQNPKFEPILSEIGPRIQAQIPEEPNFEPFPQTLLALNSLTFFKYHRVWPPL